MAIPESLRLSGFRERRSALSQDRFRPRLPEEVQVIGSKNGNVDCILWKHFGTNMKHRLCTLHEPAIAFGTISEISSQNVDIDHECGTMRQGPGNSCRLPVPGPNRALGVGTPATGNRAGAGGVRCCLSMRAVVRRSFNVLRPGQTSVRPRGIDRKPGRGPKTDPNGVLLCMFS